MPEMDGTATFGPQPKIQVWGNQMTYERLPRDASYHSRLQSLRTLVSSRMDRSANACQARFEKFYRFERVVHMITKKKAFDWQANAFLPYGFAIAEQSAAVKFLTLFLTRPYVSVQARISGLDSVAIRRQALLDWHMTGDVQMPDLAVDMFRQSERYGKALAMIAPVWDTKILKFRERKELPTAYGPIPRVAWKMDSQRNYRIGATLLDLTDFRPEPGKKRINGPGGMRYCGRVYNLTLGELKELESAQILGPAVGGEIMDSIKTSKQVETSEYKLRRMFLSQSADMTGADTDTYDQNVQLCDYTGNVPSDLLDPAMAQMEENAGLNPNERIITLANNDVVVQNVAMPWDHGMKPFIEMNCVRDPYDFWGKGKIEPMEHLQYVGNEIVNMRLNNVKMAVNKLIGVDETKMPPGWTRRLVSQPFGVVRTIGPPSSVIQAIPFGDVTQSSYQEQGEMWSLAQESSAVNETMLGARSSGARTLGEHQLKLESASKRLQFELVSQAQELLGFPYGAAAFIIGLDRQYLPLGTYIRVIRPETADDFMDIRVEPEDLGMEDEKFAYFPTGSTEGINQTAKRSDLSYMLQSLGPYAQILMESGFNFAELIRTILKAFGHDPNKFFAKTQGVIGPEHGLQAVAQAEGLNRNAPPSPMDERGMATQVPPQGQGGMASPGMQNRAVLQEAMRRMYGS